MSVRSSGSPLFGGPHLSERFSRCWNDPMKNMICRLDPLGDIKWRDRSVGKNERKYRWILGMKLGMFKLCICNVSTLESV